LPELTIALLVLALSVVVLVGLGNSYLSILNSYPQRFLALNVAQEGLELAIALRNKQIELQPVFFSDWLGVTETGTYCLQFNTSTGEILAWKSSNPCDVFPGYKRLITYSNTYFDRLVFVRVVRVISEVYFEGEKISLDIILTKWHPNQYQ
jgi:hypothetical protein